MGTISVSLPADGTTADVADYNTPITAIVDEFNGGIDNDNIAAGAAITGSKLADNSIDLGDKASDWDGWIEVTDSWVYASATTVTVPSDATTKYSVGDRVKFDQSGTKYFYITAVAATTLTLNGGSDYTVANATISAVSYSKVSSPLGFPQWFAYTTNGSGFSSTSSNVGRFHIIGRVCHVYLNIVGTSNATSFGADVPVASAATGGGMTIAFRGQDNTSFSTSPRAAVLGDNDTSLTLLTNFSTGTTWTGSGTKSIEACKFSYAI